MPNQRILVIDDEEAILEVIQGCLEELAGCEVLTATSGRAGLHLARSHPLNGILLDVSMPEMDGLEVLQQLQIHTETCRIPVVLLTAKVQSEDQAKFKELEIAGIILKPFEPMELVNQVLVAFGWE